MTRDPDLGNPPYGRYHHDWVPYEHQVYAACVLGRWLVFKGPSPMLVGLKVRPATPEERQTTWEVT